MYHLRASLELLLNGRYHPLLHRLHLSWITSWASQTVPNRIMTIIGQDLEIVFHASTFLPHEEIAPAILLTQHTIPSAQDETLAIPLHQFLLQGRIEICPVEEPAPVLERDED